MLRGQQEAQGRGFLAIIPVNANRVKCQEGCKQEIQGILGLRAQRRLSRGSGSEKTWVGLQGGLLGSNTGMCTPQATGLRSGGTKTHTRGKIPEVKCTEDESFRSRSQRCSLNGCAAVANFVMSKKQDRLEGRSQRGYHFTGQPRTPPLPPCSVPGAWGNVLLPT